MNFNTINYDGDLEDASEEELRSLAEDFESAQESNVAEFKAAKEQVTELLGDDADFEDIFGEVREFTDARDDLIGSITEYEAFDESPVSEAVLEDCSFAELREYDAYFAEQSEQADGEESEGDFNDFGTKSPTDDEEADKEAFAKKHLGDMPGF